MEEKIKLLKKKKEITNSNKGNFTMFSQQVRKYSTFISNKQEQKKYNKATLANVSFKRSKKYFKRPQMLGYRGYLDRLNKHLVRGGGYKASENKFNFLKDIKTPNWVIHSLTVRKK